MGHENGNGYGISFTKCGYVSHIPFGKLISLWKSHICSAIGMMVPIAKTRGIVFVPDKDESPWMPCAIVILWYVLWKHTVNIQWTYLDASASASKYVIYFFNVLTYRTIPRKPVCYGGFDILMRLLPNWCDFLPTRCAMGLMWLLPLSCDLNHPLVA